MSITKSMKAPKEYLLGTQKGSFGEVSHTLLSVMSETLGSLLMIHFRRI